MGFSQNVANKALVKCGRHCCICKRFVGSKIELHHIKPRAEGGSDELDNCIPLCFECHAEVGSYNPNHPKGKKYTESELKGHRDRWYELYVNKATSENNKTKFTPIFEQNKSDEIILWGYPKQDELCPILPGNLIMVAGYSENKKSLYLHHVANTNAINNQKVAYCSLKNNALDTMFKLMSENTRIEYEKIKTNYLTKQEILLLDNSPATKAGANIAVLPYEQACTKEKILDIVENSGANVVIIDDFNGIELINDKEVELFLYKLKSVASMKLVNVFMIFNMQFPKNRYDKRPILDDFPNESYYRIVDIIHLLYIPSVYDKNYFEDKLLEVHVVKGFRRRNIDIKMGISHNETCILPIDE